MANDFGSYLKLASGQTSKFVLYLFLRRHSAAARTGGEHESSVSHNAHGHNLGRFPVGLRWRPIRRRQQSGGDLPEIGSPDAKKGGTFHYWIDSFPATFRFIGPVTRSGS